MQDSKQIIANFFELRKGLDKYKWVCQRCTLPPDSETCSSFYYYRVPGYVKGFKASLSWYDAEFIQWCRDIEVWALAHTNTEITSIEVAKLVDKDKLERYLRHVVRVFTENIVKGRIKTLRQTYQSNGYLSSGLQAQVTKGANPFNFEDFAKYQTHLKTLTYKLSCISKVETLGDIRSVIASLPKTAVGFRWMVKFLINLKAQNVDPPLLNYAQDCLDRLWHDRYKRSQINATSPWHQIYDYVLDLELRQDIDRTCNFWLLQEKSFPQVRFLLLSYGAFDSWRKDFKEDFPKLFPCVEHIHIRGLRGLGIPDFSTNSGFEGWENTPKISWDGPSWIEDRIVSFCPDAVSMSLLTARKQVFG